MSEPFLRGLDTLDDVRLVGGKGRSLQELRAAGAPVPDALILTTAFSDEMVRRGNSSSDRCASALAEARARLAGQSLIVRSSAVGEDSEAAAFAGLLVSIFPVDPADPDALEAAVRACVASRDAPRVRAYEAARGTRLGGIAVVVQRLVDCAAAGVLFTDGVMLRGEFVRGHGKDLVDGAITPGAFRLDRRVSGGAPREVLVDRLPEDGAPFPLDAAAAAALVTHATALERRRGRSLDIEWALDRSGSPWFVQARPVTTSATHLFSSANIGENFPSPVTPLLASFARAGYEAYFKNLARELGIDEARIAAKSGALRDIVCVHGARLHYNLTHIHEVLRLMPFGDVFVDSFDAFVGAGESAKVGAPVREELASLGRVLAHVALAYRDLPARIERFEAAVDDVAERFHPDKLASMPRERLAEGLAAILDIRVRRWIDASLADCAAALTHRALGAFLLGVLPGVAGEASQHHALLEGLDVAGAWSLRALWDLAVDVAADEGAREALASCQTFSAFRAALSPSLGVRVDAWLDRHGFRGSGELLLTEPSLQEEPDRLLPLLARYVACMEDGETQSPAASLDHQRQTREAETERIRASLGGPRRVLRPLFDALLAATQASVRLRERARFRQALLYTRLRGVALALGRRFFATRVLDAVDDVFFLEFDELSRLAAGRAPSLDPRALVALRRAEHEALSALELPEAFTLPVGATVTPEALSGGVRASASAAEEDASLLLGIAASGGRVVARAAVLGGLADASLLEPGDVLVARQTDPGWAPLFFLVKGLVLERGGMLSHGSILARELGIPSVVGVRDATARIATGHTIEIDGDRGRVRLV